MPTRQSKPKWLVCALLSAHIKEPDQVIQSMETFLVSRGDQVVARVIQRRGVSRSKNPGGSKLMDQPITQRTLFGPGKTQELAAMAKSTEASDLLIFNSITASQRRSLAELTGAEIHSFSDDPPFSSVTKPLV